MVGFFRKLFFLGKVKDFDCHCSIRFCILLILQLFIQIKHFANEIIELIQLKSFVSYFLKFQSIPYKHKIRVK